MSPARHHLLLTTDAVGGVWTYSVDLAEALANLGYETLLAVTGPPPSTTQRAAAATLPGVTLVETGLPLDWLAVDSDELDVCGRRIAELAGDAGATIVQLNAPSLAATARFPAPVVAVTHSCTATWWAAVEGGDLPADFVWRAEVMNRGLRAADHVVAPSAAFADATMRTYGLPIRPSVVHNGRAVRSARPAAIHDCAFAAGRLWDRGKDIATLDRAAERLAIPFKAAGNVRGPTGETVDLDHLIPVGLLGDDEIRAKLASRPVFVSAARYEPFGLAVLEAAAAGCALVLSDIATHHELWDGAAMFVTPGNDRGFAAVIEALIGDTSWRAQLGAAAKDRAARFTPAAMATAMDAIYRSVGSGRARAAA